jgi:hypothetical protein
VFFSNKVLWNGKIKEKHCIEKKKKKTIGTLKGEKSM